MQTTDTTEITANRYQEQTYQNIEFDISSFVTLVSFLISTIIPQIATIQHHFQFLNRQVQFINSYIIVHDIRIDLQLGLVDELEKLIDISYFFQFLRIASFY